MRKQESDVVIDDEVMRITCLLSNCLHRKFSTVAGHSLQESHKNFRLSFQCYVQVGHKLSNIAHRSILSRMRFTRKLPMCRPQKSYPSSFG